MRRLLFIALAASPIAIIAGSVFAVSRSSQAAGLWAFAFVYLALYAPLILLGTVPGLISRREREVRVFVFAGLSTLFSGAIGLALSQANEMVSVKEFGQMLLLATPLVCWFVLTSMLNYVCGDASTAGCVSISPQLVALVLMVFFYMYVSSRPRGGDEAVGIGLVGMVTLVPAGFASAIGMILAGLQVLNRALNDDL